MINLCALAIAAAALPIPTTRPVAWMKTDQSYGGGTYVWYSPPTYESIYEEGLLVGSQCVHEGDVWTWRDGWPTPRPYYGWQFLDVSWDGKVMTMHRAGQYWIVPVWGPDLNHDGKLNDKDFGILRRAIKDGSIMGDVNGDGRTTTEDLVEFNRAAGTEYGIREDRP